MVKDLFAMSQVLSGKLGKLPDPTLNAAPRYDIAYQFPGGPLSSSACPNASTWTRVRPPWRREQLDGEDIEYQCDECSRVLTSYGGLTAHQAHQHGRVAWTRRYVGSTLCPVCCGEY